MDTTPLMRWPPEQRKKCSLCEPRTSRVAGGHRITVAIVASHGQTEQQINCPLFGQHRTTYQLPDFAGWVAEFRCRRSSHFLIYGRHV